MSPRNEVSAFRFPWAAGLHFSQSVATDELVFTSGQAGFLPDGQLVGQDFESQLHQAFRNLDEVLRAQDASLDTLLRLNTYLSDASQYAAFKRIRAEYLRQPYPASTAVIVGMVFEGMLVELEGVAVRGAIRAPARAASQSPRGGAA